MRHFPAGCGEGYIVIASAESVPVNDSPAYTLHQSDTFTANNQIYIISEIKTSANSEGKLVRSASFKHVKSGKMISFGKSAAITMAIVQGGLPTAVSYTLSTGTITLGGEKYGAYYPNNKTVQLISNDVYSQEFSSVKSLSERLRGMWIVLILNALSGILVIGLSYLPRRGQLACNW